MQYISGTPRNQLCLFQEKLDDLIQEDQLVRFIDIYVDKLDLIKLEVFNIDRTTGRPGYNPALYLKIYIYSYLNKIRSSRKIETECKRNIELIWLTEQLTPDHWSISNFRKRNKKAIKNIFKEFLSFCHKLNLLSFECIAIDGTKMRSQNSLSNVYKKKEIDKILENVEKKIEDYMADLEENDKTEKSEYEFLNKNIPVKLKRLRTHKEKIKSIQEVFNNNPELEKYFANDPDCSFQKDNGRCVAGYNCQSSVDEKSKLIVATDVTNQNNDTYQLVPMYENTNKIKTSLKVSKKSFFVLDAGYHSEREIIKAINNDESTDLYIPHPKDVKNDVKYKKVKKGTVPAPGFKKENFIYDKEKNVFICPENQTLTQDGKSRIKHGTETITYKCRTYLNCKSRELCSTTRYGRRVEASTKYDVMIKFREKVNSDIGKKIIRKRKELVEHPFGTIKRNLGYTYFMQTGIESVKTEFSFIAFIYNLRRVINIFGVTNLIEVLK